MMNQYAHQFQNFRPSHLSSNSWSSRRRVPAPLTHLVPPTTGWPSRGLLRLHGFARTHGSTWTRTIRQHGSWIILRLGWFTTWINIKLIHHINHHISPLKQLMRHDPTSTMKLSTGNTHPTTRSDPLFIYIRHGLTPLVLFITPKFTGTEKKNRPLFLRAWAACLRRRNGWPIGEPFIHQV